MYLSTEEPIYVIPIQLKPRVTVITIISIFVKKRQKIALTFS